MKRGYYVVDVNNVGKNNPVQLVGKYIESWRLKHTYRTGKEVWYKNSLGLWYQVGRNNELLSKPKPKLIQMLELIGAG